MSFSLSGSTITQSGTDADLSGLSGIAGVTTLAEGSASKPYTTYSIGDRRLTIDGTLSHDPASEMLVIGDGISGASVLVNSGTYNYGITTVFSGFTQRSTDLGLVITRISNSNFDQPVFDVNGSGTFNWNGGVINTGGTFYFRASSTVTINDAVINIQNPNGGQLFRSFTTNLNVNGLKKIGGAVLLYSSPASFAGYEPIHSDLSPQSSGRQDYSLLFYGNSTAITVEDFKGFGNPNDIGYIDNGGAILKNPLNGSSTTIGGWLSGSRSDTYIRTTKDVEFSFVDNLGAVVSPKVYAVDVDSGNRKDQNGNNDLADKVYSSTAVSGSASADVITGIYNALNTQNDIMDVRFTGDVASFKFAEYSRALSSTSVNLKGNGAALVNWILFPDTLVTQSVRATVDAYSTLDDSLELYDRAKSNLCTNFAGQVATFVTRSGNATDAGAYNVNIDATAGVAFAISGNTITINTGAFTGDMTTTGVITLLNGATFIGTRTDANGTIAPSVTYALQLPNIIAGSRYQIYNVTSATELDNDVLASGGVDETYTKGTDYTAGDTGRYRVTYQSGAGAKEFIEGTFTFPADSAVNSLPVAQVDDAVYVANGIDGSSLTSLFSADFVANEIDIIAATNFQGTGLYAYFVYVTTTAAGIAGFAGGFTAFDQANYRVNVAILDAYLNNNTTTNIVQIDNVRIYRSDGAYPARNPTTGGGGIDVVWRNQIFIAETGVSGLTSAESTKLLSLDTANLDAAVSSRSTFDATAQDVTTDAASRDASKADISTLATLASLAGVEADLEKINGGVQKSSKLIPYSGDL